MPVELRNEQRRIRVEAARIKREAERLLAAVGREGEMLSILLTDDRRIARLRERWMGDPAPTDVLSFEGDGSFWDTLERLDCPRMNRPQVVGDIAISLETAARRKPGDVLGETRRYLVHGFLHLLGHDHRTRREKLRMDRQAHRLMKEFP